MARHPRHRPRIPAPQVSACGTEAQIIDALIGGTELVREGAEVHIGLPTPMGRDEWPGEIAGVGPVSADVARTAVARQYRGGSWEFAIVDDNGHLLHGGFLRSRPKTGGGKARGEVVQIHLTLAELEALIADPGVWAGTLAEIARNWANRDKKKAARRRFFRGPVARNRRLRDQNCIGPGCTRTARRSDLDHTLDHGKGGDTVEENAGPACYRHHPDKDRGWSLSQPAPGRFVWTSPLGRVYTTRGEPIRHELPEPQPAARRVDLRVRWQPPAPPPRPPPF